MRAHVMHTPGRQRPMAPHHRTHQQRGSTLIEALLAFLVLAGGVLSMTVFQLHLHTQADQSRLRTQAMRLAQTDLESLRTSAGTPLPAETAGTTGTPTPEAPFSTTTDIDTTSNPAPSATFQGLRRIDSTSSPHLQATMVQVSWDARDGQPQQAVLNSMIANENPRLAGALALPPHLRGIASRYTRAAGIPWNARTLGDGHSTQSLNGIVYVFDPLTAQVTQRCTDTAADRLATPLTVADLGTCTVLQAVWLSGTVRYSAATPPDPDAANDLPLDATVTVTLTDTPTTATPVCHTEALKTVQYRLADGLHQAAVPLQALPGSVGASEWRELGERYLEYQCVVPVASTTQRWSGRSTVLPRGWTLGTTPTAHRVCRYVTDADLSGAIDRNDEHPSVYQDVDSTLRQQNFLVIRGDQSCPDGTAPRITPQTMPEASPTRTAAHQP